MWQYDKVTNAFVPGILPADGSKINACYTRLSQEDELDGDSGSILNQRDFLLKYCTEQGLNHVRFFSDGPVKIGLNQQHPTARGALV